LSLIGEAAAEAIQWERAQAGRGTATERSQAAALTSIRREAERGATYRDLVVRYGNELPTYKIREAYNAVGYYPTGAKETAEEERRLREGETISKPSDYEVVRGNVINMKNANKSLDDINTFIRQNGYDPSQFADILGGYSPSPERPWYLKPFGA